MSTTPITQKNDSQQSSMPTIVFDLGGVLVDWDPRYLYHQVSSDKEKIEYFLTQVFTPDWNHRLDLGHDWQMIKNELISLHPDYETWINLYWDEWKKMLRGEVSGSVKLLSKIKKAGYHVLALSNWNDIKFNESLQIFPFFHWFDGRLISGEVGLAKPDIAIYHRLISDYDLDAAKTLFIDDKIENIMAAQTIGFQTILFKNPMQLSEDLELKHIHV